MSIPPFIPADAQLPNAHERSEALKERIYVTFTALAVTVALERDLGHATAGTAALTLVLTVMGTLLAVFIADIIAHLVRLEALPSKRELVHLTWVSFGSLAVLIVPLVILGLSALGVMGIGVALRAISLTLVATLLVVTLFALRRLRVSGWSKVMLLALVAALGTAALVIDLAAH